jgi:hypothetical protein
MFKESETFVKWDCSIFLIFIKNGNPILWLNFTIVTEMSTRN